MSTEHVTVAAIQCRLDGDSEDNLIRVTRLLREAAASGAQIVLPPELFEGRYFPQNQLASDFDRARPAKGHPTLLHFQKLASEHEVAIPVSFFERDRHCCYNSTAIIDANGDILGVYRKCHIPDGPGYQEKFFFRPGGQRPRAWKTRFASIGIGICWDQWFPEAARLMALDGAEILLYPTAIGSEPHEPEVDTRDPWQRVMQGHAIANSCGLVAANRIGVEDEITFYGSSFICDYRGDLIAELGREDEGIITASFDLDAMRRWRDSFGLFRDRRPELYGPIADIDLPSPHSS